MKVLVIFIAAQALSSASQVNSKRGINYGQYNTNPKDNDLTEADISAGAALAFDNRVSFARGPLHSDMGDAADSALRDIAHYESLTQQNEGAVLNTGSQASYAQNKPESRQPSQEYGELGPPTTSSETETIPTLEGSFGGNHETQSSVEVSSSNGSSLQGPSVAAGTVIGHPYLISIHHETVRRYGVPVARPYPVMVAKEVKVPIERRVPVTVDRPYAVRVNVPQPYAVDRPYPVPVDRPYAVSVPQPIGVPVPQPVAVHLSQPVPVPVSQSAPVLVRAPIPQPLTVSVPEPLPILGPVAAPNPAAISSQLALPSPAAIAPPVGTLTEIRAASVAVDQAAPVAISHAIGAFPAFGLSQSTLASALPEPTATSGQGIGFAHPQSLQASISSARPPFVSLGLSSTSFGATEGELIPSPLPPSTYQGGIQVKRSVYKY